MLSGDSVSYNGSRGQVPEPLFHDTPFDESEWRALYDILRQVNQPKAELMRVQGVHAAQKLAQVRLAVIDRARHAPLHPWGRFLRAQMLQPVQNLLAWDARVGQFGKLGSASSLGRICARAICST